jgi:hypothetical protein
LAEKVTLVNFCSQSRVTISELPAFGMSSLLLPSDASSRTMSNDSAQFYQWDTHTWTSGVVVSHSDGVVFTASETHCLRPCLRVRRYLANFTLFLHVKQAQTRLIQYSLIVIQYSLESLAQKPASCHCLSIYLRSIRFQSTGSDSSFC